jgi:hypothetical protein
VRRSTATAEQNNRRPGWCTLPPYVRVCALYMRPNCAHPPPHATQRRGERAGGLTREVERPPPSNHPRCHQLVPLQLKPAYRRIDILLIDLPPRCAPVSAVIITLSSRWSTVPMSLSYTTPQLRSGRAPEQRHIRQVASERADREVRVSRLQHRGQIVHHRRAMQPAVQLPHLQRVCELRDTERERERERERAAHTHQQTWVMCRL